MLSLGTHGALLPFVWRLIDVARIFFVSDPKIGVRLEDGGGIVLSPDYQVAPNREVNLEKHSIQESDKAEKEGDRLRPDG